MFEFGKTSGRSVVKTLIAINVIVFLLEMTLNPAGQRWVGNTFGLSWNGLRNGMLWQLATHLFLHGNLLHLIVNMVGLWYAGRILENLMGPRTFLILFFVCGFVGGLVQMLLVPSSILIGASGSVFGVVCAFAALFPEMRITALLFFVIPVNLKAKWLGWGLVGISAFFALTGWGGSIGHAAHLGGALAGYAFVMLGRRSAFRIVRRRDL